MDNVKKRELIAHAKQIAQGILNGKIDPNQGCSRIASVAEHLDWPTELSMFTLLAHEQTGHESLGITSENIRPDILQAAKELLQSS